MGVADVVTSTTHKKERGEGELQAIDLRRLLIGVPDEAVIDVKTNDTNDYREGGKARWWFKANWRSAPGVKVTQRPPLKEPRRERLRSSIAPPPAPTSPGTVQPVPRPEVGIVFVERTEP